MRKRLIIMFVIVMLVSIALFLVACDKEELPPPGTNVMVLHVDSVEDLRVYMGQDYLLPNNDNVSGIALRHSYKAIWQESGKTPSYMEGIESVNMVAKFRDVDISVAINVIADYGHIATPVPPNAVKITDEIMALEIIDADSNSVQYLFFLRDLMYKVTDIGISSINDNLDMNTKLARSEILRQFIVSFSYQHACA